MSQPGRLAVLLATLSLVVACGGTGPGDEPPSTGGAVILSISPEPGADDFFFEADLWAQFDEAPDSVTMSLSGASGDVAAEQSTADGIVFSLDPVSNLESSTSYTLTIEWTPSDNPPLEVDFQTGPHGTPLNDEAALVGTVFQLDLGGATFLEPPGVGPIIASQLEGVPILISATGDSNFAAGELHVLGALGDSDGDSVVQDLCTETLAWTWGQDGLLGTADDQPATWNNPRFEVGPADLTLVIQGIQARIYDVYTSGVIHPELEDILGGEFSGMLDTRALDSLIDEDGGEGATCDLVAETVGISCEECPPAFPGTFCLNAHAIDIASDRIPGLSLEIVSCVDIIERTIAGTCPETDAATFDGDGDGVFELCPDYVP